MGIPRPEYPRPQFRRDKWINLNGEWKVKLDHESTRQSYYREFPEILPDVAYSGHITVPFCPESSLSGIGNKEFLAGMTYGRDITIPSDWEGMDILLNFGAVYYKCAVYLDGRLVGRHTGGSVSFSIDLTGHIRAGETKRLNVAVRTNLWEGVQPSGKQSSIYHSHKCFYTRTTGIWQTVWLEAVSSCGLDSLILNTDLESCSLLMTPLFRSSSPGQKISVTVSLEGEEKAVYSGRGLTGRTIAIPLENPSLWSPDSPVLYDLILTVTDRNGQILDRVESYHGMREISVEGDRFLLNGEACYQRLVLDQGFYPEGIWTAPSDEALKEDILLSRRAGFNGARLHQKVFESRFYYWADRLGYLCWGETASWGSNYNQEGLTHMNFLSELREEIARDRNHPSLIVWTPFNETWDVVNREQHERIHRACYDLCRSMDPARPVNDASGYIHYVTDLYTVHQYEQDPAKLKEILSLDGEGKPFRNFPDVDSEYKGQPYLLDEFGGIKWDPSAGKGVDDDGDMEKKNRWVSWGYGKDVTSEEEFYHRLEKQVKAVLSLSHIRGYCYTQLTDVEQETNGIYSYDRSEKFDRDRIRKIFSANPEG